MERENYHWLLVLTIFLEVITPPVTGFFVSYTTGDGSGAVSSSSSYILDDSSSLQQEATLAGSEISQTFQASGAGNNTIESSVGGNGHSAESTIDSSGSMAVSSTAAATQCGAGISQRVALSGSSGYTAMAASSSENQMGLASSFSGESSMNADLSAVATDSAYMTGTAKIAGVPVLERGSLEQVSSGEIGMSVDGLYAQPSGSLGEFSLSTVNVKNVPSSSSHAQLLKPAYTDNSIGGSPNSYILAGWRWNTYNPTIKWYVKSNTVPSAVGTTNAVKAVANAANTWNSASNQKLFNTAVSSSSSVSTDKYDKNNVVAWKYLSDAPSALAYSRTWYTYNKKDGYYSAVESDISLNTRYSWSTSQKDGTAYRSGSAIDVESVVLHEMGHTLGLRDLYGNTQYSSDIKQIMNSYRGVKHTLGNGDKTGIWVLYD